MICVRSVVSHAFDGVDASIVVAAVAIMAGIDMPTSTLDVLVTIDSFDANQLSITWSVLFIASYTSNKSIVPPKPIFFTMLCGAIVITLIFLLIFFFTAAICFYMWRLLQDEAVKKKHRRAMRGLIAYNPEYHSCMYLWVSCRATINVVAVWAEDKLMNRVRKIRDRFDDFRSSAILNVMSLAMCVNIYRDGMTRSINSFQLCTTNYNRRLLTTIATVTNFAHTQKNLL